ncbi:MAG: hypothetical protein OEU26_17110 [Candidatus Tectomicrobia bacterium]|nr:hypothetical protein [Candidatus Tectomicrobia bacterium]
MRYPFTWSVDNPRGSSHRRRFWDHLALTLIVSGMMLGCSSGGGGDDNATRSCGGSSINNFMNDQVAETTAGLTFTFMDGEVFQDTLSGDTVTFTLDTFTGTTLMMTVATQDYMASGEAELVACNFFSQPACVFDVIVTESDFPSGEGPQMDDVLIIQDWRLVARLDNCTNRITANMIVEDAMDMAVASELLDLDATELCPMIGICP